VGEEKNSREELLGRIDAAPEKFNPNVLLRRWCRLPAAYAVYTAERRSGYFAQAGVVYENCWTGDADSAAVFGDAGRGEGERILSAINWAAEVLLVRRKCVRRLRSVFASGFAGAFFGGVCECGAVDESLRNRLASWIQL